MADEKDKYELFGNYLILDHMVDGGMAKICRAFQLTEQESRVVAIKMVQPQYSKDESFKQMFNDEVKLTFQLHHPNIVQIIDSGMYNEQLFVSMEYCDGRNLKEYLDKLKKIKDGEFKGFFPPAVAAHVVSDVCFALQYAHNFTDKLTGKKANIIHRDISPHNIMLNFDGTVKVIDFGIAKSEKSSEATQAGTIKGKLSYLAPEYLEGQQLDHRYDQFAVGITLWELLTGQKLFKAANDLAVLKKIQECKIIPPSKINPTVPPELDLIVLKALQKNREKRFKDMQDFGDTLKVFLYKRYPKFSSKQVVQVINTVFKDEIKKDREKLFRFGKIDIKQYLEIIRSGAQKLSAPSSSSAKEKSRKQEVVLDFGFEEEDKTSSSTVSRALKSKTTTTKSDSASRSTEVKELLEIDKTTTGTQRKNLSNKTRTQIRPKAKKGATRVAQIEKKSSSKVPVIAAGVALALAFSGYRYFTRPAVETTGEVQPVKSEENNTGRVPSAENETANVLLKDIDKQKHRVFVDGERVNPDILGIIKVPRNKEIVIRVESTDREHFIYRNKFTEAGGNEVTIQRTPFAYFGYLTTSRSCIYGKLNFELFGEQRVEKLPISNRYGIRLATNIDENGRPVAKDYVLYYQRDGEDIERKTTVTIEDGVSIDLCKNLD
ncbi:kinase domain protein [Bacteriovorax sp. BSW11_IV]|uniref:serine/threonine protein kinase n=1 Tax=Bacteriovorax sp. BSW11_IV TaxID=1353529 RepID=UPI00038A26FD|nr:serine/threonine-protein kinase [Bacteriovorax sp. BSW11_IV]EQC48199.1 kinase domain protein [Bacteriovorax sp. BSW11_IV]